MAKKYSGKRFTVPEPVFKKYHLVNSSDKIKRIRMVCRGGPSDKLNFDIFSKDPITSDLNMNVNNSTHIQIQNYPHEEDRQTSSKPRRSVETKLEKSLRSSDQNKDSTNDYDEAMSYISLLKTVKRRRKFDEISVDLKKTVHQDYQNNQISRRQRLLSNLEPNCDIPGNFKSANSNLTVAGENTDADGESNSADLASNDECLVFQKKRMTPDSESIDSDGLELVDMTEARKGMQNLRIEPKPF